MSTTSENPFKQVFSFACPTGLWEWRENGACQLLLKLHCTKTLLKE